MAQQGRYYTHFGLIRSPFDKVPDPEMYWDQHRSIEYAVSTTILAIEQGSIPITLISGELGFGKTMALLVIIERISQEQYKFAFVRKPHMNFNQLLQQIIGQLSGKISSEHRRERMLEAFDQVLLKLRAEGKKVAILIDEAHVMRPSVLEDLSLLDNMRADDEPLFTMILAGQPALAQRLEHPKCAQLFQRLGVHCRLSKIDSQELTQQYVEHRLARAGATRRIFTDDAYEALWQYSENGIPRLIHRIAKLALKVGQTRGVEVIHADVIRQIGARFAYSSKPLTPTARGCLALPSLYPGSTPRSPEGTIPMADSAGQPPGSPFLQDMIEFPQPLRFKILELSPDQRLQLAGQLASQVLQRHPHLIQQLGSTTDPVPAWTILRNVIVRQFEQA